MNDILENKICNNRPKKGKEYRKELGLTNKQQITNKKKKKKKYNKSKMKCLLRNNNIACMHILIQSPSQEMNPSQNVTRS